MEFIAKVEICLNIEANNREEAEELISNNKPFISVKGISVGKGFYSIETTGWQRIVAIRKRPTRKGRVEDVK